MKGEEGEERRGKRARTFDFGTNVEGGAAKGVSVLAYGGGESG